MSLRKPRGTQDFLPEQVAQWNYVEKKIKDICACYGLGEIRTPIFEKTSLFLRSIGDTTDVVQKEMYTFTTGEGKESYALRPENTASSVRAYLENKVYGKEGVTKWFYIGPMFRHDKPQAGRYRQFHQFGVEVLGSQSACTDAEMIVMVIQLFQELGLQDLSLELNSVGCPVCRPKYRQALIDYFEPMKEDLCHDCQGRLDRNPLRVLDCKKDRDKGEDAPIITDYLCPDCKEHFEEVQAFLEAAHIEYHLNPRLVRGLDYYTKTAFEIQYTPLGAQSAIAGGGRYDGLVEELGGLATPAFGFAVGMERLLLALEKQAALPQEEHPYSFFMVALGDRPRRKAFALLESLRKEYIPIMMDEDGKSMKSQLKSANKNQAKYVIIIGDDELDKDEVQLRNMETGEQSPLAIQDVEQIIKNLAKGCNK